MIPTTMQGCVDEILWLQARYSEALAALKALAEDPDVNRVFDLSTARNVIARMEGRGLQTEPNPEDNAGIVPADEKGLRLKEKTYPRVIGPRERREDGRDLD